MAKFSKQVKSFDRKTETKYFSCYLRRNSWKWLHTSDELAMICSDFTQISYSLFSENTDSFSDWNIQFFFFFSKVVAALVALRESGDLSKEEKLNSSIPSSDIGQWTRTKRCVLIWSNSIQAFFKYVLPLSSVFYESCPHLFDQLLRFHDSFFCSCVKH